MRRKIISVLLTFAMVLTLIQGSSVEVNAAWAIDNDIGSDDGWVEAYSANDQNDYLQDQQTGSGTVSQDIVGNADYPSAYAHLTETEIAFRIRVNSVDGNNNNEFKNFAFVGMDVDVDGSVDFFLGAYNPTGNNGRLGIYDADSDKDNMGPSTTGISGKPIAEFEPEAKVNYAITVAETYFGADGEDPDDETTGDADYFLSFAFNLSDVTDTFEKKGITFDSGTPFRFITGTASQDNSFNQDINGMNKDDWSSDNTWSELGTFSPVVSADGTTFHTIYFDKNTGDAEATPSMDIYAEDEAIANLPAGENLPTKEGMTFVGWNTEADGSGTYVTSAYEATDDDTFYAIWEAEEDDEPESEYDVEFDLNNAEVTWKNPADSSDVKTIHTTSSVLGDLLPEESDVNLPKKLRLVGWNTDSDGDGEWIWSATDITAMSTFDSEEGTLDVFGIWENDVNPSVKTAYFYDEEYGEDQRGPIRTYYFKGNMDVEYFELTRSGYEMTTWDFYETGTTESSVSYSEGTMTLELDGAFYPDWELMSYSITYDVGDGTNNPSNPTSYTVETETFTLDDPTPPEGYEFTGWSSEGIEGATVTQGENTTDLMFTASWEQMESDDYLEDISSEVQLTGTYTSDISVNNVHPEAVGYFNSLRAGSYSTGDLLVKLIMTVDEVDENTEDSTLEVAVGAVNARAVADDFENGLYLDLNINRYMKTAQADPWPETGEKVTETGGLIEVIIPMPESIQGYNEYRVYRYHDNSAHTITEKDILDSSQVEYLEWDEDDWTLHLYVNRFSVYAISYPVNVYFSGSSNSTSDTYRVTFDGNGGEPETTYDYVDENELLDEPEDPVRDGYSFLGWEDETGELWDFDNDVVTGRITLIASWISMTELLDSYNHFAYMQGYPDRTFRQDNNMTRAEVTVMFARLMVEKMDIEASYSNSFSDVDSAKWYTNAIGYMEKYDITSGYPDGTFRPDDSITRAEFVTIAAKFVEASVSDSPDFPDVSETHWAYESIAELANGGWINGFPDGTFMPEKYITRAEVVTIVNNILNRQLDESFANANQSLIIDYIDLKKGFWAYEDIIEASNGHDYEMNEDAERWIKLQ